MLCYFTMRDWSVLAKPTTVLIQSFEIERVALPFRPTDVFR
jgi:hypothetical protein